MAQDYPVTRLQAAKWLRQGQRLEVDMRGEGAVQVMIRWSTFPKQANLRLWGLSHVWWTKVSWKQLLGFIRRNYGRGYEEPIG